MEIWYSTSDTATGGISLGSLSKGTQTCTVNGGPGDTLYFHFIAVDKNGNRSGVVNYVVTLNQVPAPVLNLTGAITASGTVTLTWTDPVSPTFDYAELWYKKAGEVATVSLSPVGKGAQTCTVQGLNASTPYVFYVEAVNTDSSISILSGNTASVTLILSQDFTAPGPVTGLSAVDNEFGRVTLTWTNPGDEDLQYVEITCEPFMGPARTVNAASSDPESYIWNGLAGGETYTFTLKTVDDSGNRGAPVSITGTPYDTTPPAPVPNLTISPGDGCAVLTWTDPADADL